MSTFQLTPQLKYEFTANFILACVSDYNMQEKTNDDFKNDLPRLISIANETVSSIFNSIPQEQEQKEEQEEVNQKMCSTCNTQKPLTEFYSTTNPRGFTSSCKTCIRERQQKYYKKSYKK